VPSRPGRCRRAATGGSASSQNPGATAPIASSSRGKKKPSEVSNHRLSAPFRGSRSCAPGAPGRNQFGPIFAGAPLHGTPGTTGLARAGPHFATPTGRFQVLVTEMPTSPPVGHLPGRDFPTGPLYWWRSARRAAPCDRGRFFDQHRHHTHIGVFGSVGQSMHRYGLTPFGGNGFLFTTAGDRGRFVHITALEGKVKVFNVGNKSLETVEGGEESNGKVEKWHGFRVRGKFCQARRLRGKAGTVGPGPTGPRACRPGRRTRAVVTGWHEFATGQGVWVGQMPTAHWQRGLALTAGR